MKRKHIFPFLAILSLFVFYACGSTHSITASWKSEQIPDKHYEKLFIVALTKNLESKIAIENNMAQEVIDRGGVVVKGSSVIPPNMNSLDTNLIIQKIKETGCDALLTIALIDTKTDEYYVPGTTESYTSGGAYTPGSNYYRNYADSQYDNNNNYYRRQGNPYGYYDQTTTTTTTPGYYETETTYFLQTNLWDIENSDLLYAVQSKAYEPGEVNKESKAYAKLIFKQMVIDGLIKEEEK